jgi:WD40 repeat protein
VGNEKGKRTGRPIGAVLTLLIALACVLTVLMIIESRSPAEIEIPETPDVTHFVVVCTLSADAGSTRSMSWAPDSARIATGEGDGLVVVWNARTGERELTFHGEPGYRIEDVIWSPDGKRVAAKTGQNEFKVFDPESGDIEWTVVDPEVYALAGWSEDGKSVKTWNGEEYFSLWNVEAKTMGNRWFVSIGEQSRRLSPDGKLAAWQVGDNTWTVHTLYGDEFEEWELRGHSGRIHAVSWSPDSLRLAGATDQGVAVWNARTGELELEGAAGDFANVSWSPDGRHILAYTDEDLGVILDAKRVHPVAEISVDGRRWWAAPAAWSPDGSLLAAMSPDGDVAIIGQTTH